MKTKEIPAIIMLTAGLIDCVVSIYYHYSLFQFTKQLLIVLVVFYLLGSLVKLILDINFPVIEENTEADETEIEEGEGMEGDQEEAIYSDTNDELENIDANQQDE